MPVPHLPSLLITGLLVGLLLLQLEVFLVGIALLARLTLFMGGNAALVLAFLAIGGGLLAAGQLLGGFVSGQGGSPRREDKQARMTMSLSNFIFFNSLLMQSRIWPGKAQRTARDAI